jgi:hypothetical protein
MNNQFPMAAWRGSMDKIEAAKTVDMPLRALLAATLNQRKIWGWSTNPAEVKQLSRIGAP